MKIDKEKLSRNFSRAAAVYEQEATVQKYVSRQLARRLAGTIRPGESVLDIGSGTGFLIDELLERVPGLQITGLDLAPGMAAFCRKKFKENPGVQIIRGDGEQLRMKNAFHHVVSCSCFQWFSRIGESFQKVGESLREHGRFSAAVFVRGSLPELDESFRALGRSRGFRFSAPEVYREALEQAGFRAEKQELETRTVFYPSVPEALASFKKIGAGLPRDESDRGLDRTALRALIQSYRELYETDRGIPVSYRIFYFHASLPLSCRTPNTDFRRSSELSLRREPENHFKENRKEEEKKHE